jgi:hypothetical protein
MTNPSSTLAPLVTREALNAFTQRLVVMPFEGKPRETVEALLAAGAADFPLDLHLRRPEEIPPRNSWGDPYLREALDHGELLHGELERSTLERPGAAIPMRNPVVDEWIARAERHWRLATLLPDLPRCYLSGLFLIQRCSLESHKQAAVLQEVA